MNALQAHKSSTIIVALTSLNEIKGKAIQESTKLRLDRLAD